MTRAADASVLLTGMMGSGKTRVGGLLADRLGFRFVDTDREVERRAGRGIAEVFTACGEPAFRRLESAVLGDLPARRCVVALGGGAIAAPQNRELVRSKGHLVWLRARVGTLVERLGDAADRPLLRDLPAGARKERLEALLLERRAAYASAELCVETDDLSPERVCDTILAALATGGRS